MALHSAATAGKIDTARMLVKKNRELTRIRNKNNETPLLRAALYGHKELMLFLCLITQDAEPSLFRGQDGATLFSATIAADFYDVALHLVELYPEMATSRDHEGKLAILMLATKSWPSMSRGPDRLWEHCTYTLPTIRKVYVREIKPERYIKLVNVICDQVLLLNNEALTWDILNETILAAAEHGNVEFIKWVIDTDPSQIGSYNHSTQSVLHIAIKYRQEKIFNHLKAIGEYRNEWAWWRDDISGDNMLHLVAKLGPPSKLSAVSGAALQVQHELQWYKAVENIVQPLYRNWKNKDNKSPRQMFTDEHKDLIEKGEKWMKDMASSSMVVATLIATVVFAAAFTVPGGNKSDYGTPIFLNRKPYMVSAVSNALALFSSSTSVLIFLSILTARYGEEDFLKSLPQKLIIGLAMLFFAIATMTIAFGTTYFLMLGHGLAWVSLLISLLTCFPVTLFAFLQFPLFLEMILSTYYPTL